MMSALGRGVRRSDVLVGQLMGTDGRLVDLDYRMRRQGHTEQGKVEVRCVGCGLVDLDCRIAKDGAYDYAFQVG
jgi:hypothetical protein